MTADPDGDAAKARLVARLDFPDSGAPVRFWWRDDDATEPGPALDRLLEMRRRHDVPLALAVIPAFATEALAERLAGESDIAVLQHGWKHERHGPPGAKKAEFGDHRPLDEMLAELRAGRTKLEKLFPHTFLPVLAPPWNRVGDGVWLAREKAGLPGISGFRDLSPRGGHAAHTHLDVIDWRGTRSAVSRREAFACLQSQAESRPAGDRTPIGLLSHHRDHDEAIWDLLEEILATLARHRAVVWPSAPQVFDLEHAAEPI